MKSFSFDVQHQDTKTRARLGVIHTPHGDIETPAFVPVGTQATVKSLTPDELSALGVKLFFVNTYHAYLKPGVETLSVFGGLHRFMGWGRALITDSGGFQVFSLGAKKYVNIALSESAVLDRERFTKKLSKQEGPKEHVYPDDYRPTGELVKIDENGVTFTSHWDGSTHVFTPERSIEIQHVLGADIIIAFDECTPYPATHEYALSAMNRTHVWAKRSLAAHKRLKKTDSTSHVQALYGVVQGSVYKDLRESSAREIASMNFDGIAIGGVSVGESKKEMVDVLSWVTPFLPKEKPRHLLGVGEIDDIFALISYGMDTFDCVQPTRLARMGQVFITPGKNQAYTVDITKKLYEEDKNPLDASCGCYTCTHFSRGYIHHLFRVRELLGYRLATIHNIFFVNRLVLLIREAIADGTFLELKKRWLYNSDRR